MVREQEKKRAPAAQLKAVRLPGWLYEILPSLSRRIMLWKQITAIREKELSGLAEVCKRNGITRLVLFGSQARGDATSDSDVDLIADLPDGASLLDMVRIERELASALGRPVDLLTEDSISPYIRERILDDSRVIYEAS